MTDAIREALTARFERLPTNAANALPKEQGATIDVVNPWPGIHDHKKTRRRTVTADQIREAIRANRARIVDEAAFRLGLFGDQLGLDAAEQAAAARWWPLFSAHPDANDAWLVELLRAFTEIPCIGWPFAKHGAAVNEWWLGLVSFEPSPNDATTLYGNTAPTEAVALYLAKNPLAAHRAQVEAIADGHATKAQLAAVWREVADYLRTKGDDTPTEADFDALESATLAAVKEWRSTLDTLSDTTDDALHAAFHELIKAKHTKTAERERPKTPWATWRLVSERCGAPPWLAWLTLSVWRGVVSNTRAFVVSGVEVGGDIWTGLPKATAAVSWGFGGFGVVVDGERYATEPGVAALLPRTHAILAKELPGHEQRPHQTAFPIGYDEEEPSLAVVVADASKYAISPLASKVCLAFLADDNIKRGHMVKATLDVLTRELYPGSRIQARERASVAKAIDEIRRVHVLFPKGPRVQLFDVASASTTDPGAEIGVTIGLWFRHYTIENASNSLGKAFNGYFVANHSALMRIHATRPDALRLATRGFASINAAFNPKTKAFDPAFAQRPTVKQLGAIANTLPPGAHEANGNKRAKKAEHDTRKSILDTLEYLRDEVRAIDFETEGRGEHQTVLIRPTPGYAEAKAQLLQTGTRPIGGPRGRR